MGLPFCDHLWEHKAGRFCLCFSLLSTGSVGWRVRKDVDPSFKSRTQGKCACAPSMPSPRKVATGLVLQP